MSIPARSLFKIVMVLTFVHGAGFGQSVQSTKKMVAQTADSLYHTKNYTSATAFYIQLAGLSDFSVQKASAFYNAACCLALQHKTDSAFRYLDSAIQLGYNHRENLLADNDLITLHSTTQWPKTVAGIKESKKGLNNDPDKARFMTDDVHHFWDAYDKAYQDTVHFRRIFKTFYFDKASPGMNDYMALKVESIDAWITHIRSAPGFYQAIKKATLAVDNYKPQFRASFQRLKALYADAQFPDVYFIIGAFTSAGTVSDAGLLIGVNQVSQTEGTPVSELSPRLQTRMNKSEYLPNVIAHELIHFQQAGMKNDTITLGYVIQEGMADFLGELISGRTGNPALFTWAAGREATIWNRFKNDMYFNRYNNWIGNSKQATPDNLPDQGYWVGYQICRAYYENARNKKQAVYDMLHIKDYRLFLAQSGWEQKVAQLKGGE